MAADKRHSLKGAKQYLKTRLDQRSNGSMLAQLETSRGRNVHTNVDDVYVRGSLGITISVDVLVFSNFEITQYAWALSHSL